MGRKKKSGGSISGYFREQFKANPGLLQTKSNEEILAKYRVDHNYAPDAELPPSIKNNLANIKSVMRKEMRTVSGESRVKVVSRVSSRLETLEELIDECLIMARTIDREGLAGVILMLRKARNEVVWKLGQ